jgi:hypothetical protein
MIRCRSCSGFLHEGRKRHGLNCTAMIAHWATPPNGPSNLSVTVFEGYGTRLLRVYPAGGGGLILEHYDHLGEYRLADLSDLSSKSRCQKPSNMKMRVEGRFDRTASIFYLSTNSSRS